MKLENSYLLFSKMTDYPRFDKFRIGICSTNPTLVFQLDPRWSVLNTLNLSKMQMCVNEENIKFTSKEQFSFRTQLRYNLKSGVFIGGQMSSRLNIGCGFGHNTSFCDYLSIEIFYGVKYNLSSKESGTIASFSVVLETK